jgi:hypothetical protein
VQVADRDDDDHVEGPAPIPSSPPPPFRSRPVSPDSQRLLARDDPLATEADRTLAETFDDGSDDEDDGDDRRLLVRTDTTEADDTTPSEPDVERRLVELPAFTPRPGKAYGSGGANDGVFANLSAKPTRGEELDEKPPVSLIYCSSIETCTNC